jgi:hypothetical protein
VVAIRRNPIALFRQALSALMLAVAVLCAVPAEASPPVKQAGSAFSADTAVTAVLPPRLAARAAAAALPEPFPVPLPVVPVAVVSVPAIERPARAWPGSRAPPITALRAPVARPRAPPSA